MTGQLAAFRQAWGMDGAQVRAFLFARLAMDATLDPKGWRTDGNGNHYHIDPATGRKDAGWGSKANGQKPMESRVKAHCRKPVDINLPDSSHISTAKEAKDYYEKHLKGIHRLTIHRKAGNFTVDVDMTVNAEHAYTSDPLKAKTKGKFQGERVFDAQRARAMSKILSTISYPKNIFENFGNDVFIAKRVPEGIHAVVLRWNGKRYAFRSSHLWTSGDFQRRKRQLTGAKPRGRKE